ncbi:MAG: hypothetical protein FD129_355, partial [bacterium]
AVAMAIVIRMGHGWMEPQPIPAKAAIYSLGVTNDGRTVQLLADAGKEAKPQLPWWRPQGVFRLDVSTGRLGRSQPIGFPIDYPDLFRPPVKLACPRGNPFWSSASRATYTQLYLDLRNPEAPTMTWESALSTSSESIPAGDEASTVSRRDEACQVHDFPQGRLLIDTRCDIVRPAQAGPRVVLRSEDGVALPVSTPTGFEAGDARIIEPRGPSGGRRCEYHHSRSQYYRWVPGHCALEPFDAPAGTEAVLAASEDGQFVLLAAKPPRGTGARLDLVLQGPSLSDRRIVCRAGVLDQRQFLLGPAPDLLTMNSGVKETALELHRLGTGQVQRMSVAGDSSDASRAWRCRFRRTPYRVCGLFGRKLIVYDTRTRSIGLLPLPDLAWPSDAELLGDWMYWIQAQSEVWRIHLPSGRHERLYPR